MDGRGELTAMAPDDTGPDDLGPYDFEPEEFEDFHDDGPRYGDVSELGGMEIPAALKGLTLFRDPYLSMQAFNLAIVDGFLNGLEQQVLRRLIDEERTPIDDSMFLNAQSQMWIFAAYEVMRTWRQRAKDLIKWHANGGLQLKLATLKEDKGFHHPGNASRAAMLRDVIADPGLVDRLRDDLKRTHVLFTRMEYLRVSLAKHEVSGKAKMLAIAPGYGRINSWCGALDYELNSGQYILGYINRRDIADSLRAIPSLPVPSDEELKSFDAFMKGPPD
ncbi:MAG: hypothetical protein WBF65_02455 [Sphingopyxis granuli]|uniref:hypothetical protein n=1 Tax=Sphingopyxis granuli TaxID=267128 RepID=UPI003C762E62